MRHDVWLWVAMAAYGLHIMEEFIFDWKNWAIRVLKLDVDWPQFYVTNAVVVILGIATADVGWKLPAFALSFPSLMIINAVFFHIVPFVAKKKFSPGLITAVVLFLPLGGWIFYGAKIDGILTVNVAAVSVVLGALLMAYPIAMLKMKRKPFFKQD